MRFDAVLLAAGRLPVGPPGTHGSPAKALLAPGGVPLLERVASEVRRTQGARRIVAVGGEEVRAHPASRLLDAVLPEGASAPDNLLIALRWLLPDERPDPGDRVLVAATDLPYVRADLIESFLSSCPEDADIALPLTPSEAFDRRFPGAPREFVRLRDGQWTMGCVFLVRPAAIVAAREHIERVFRARKSQIAMARLLGLRFLAAWALGRLTVEDIEARCCDILGCRGRAVRNGAPELAFDIDGLEDYLYAEAHASSREGSTP